MVDNRRCCCILKYTKCASMHKIASCRWGGSRIGNLGGKYIGLVLRIISSRVRVYLHMSVPSLQSVIRYWSVSGGPQYLHSVVSLRWILARRSFLGMMSWITVNHTDFISSLIGAVWRLCHTLGQSVGGCSSMIRSSFSSLAAIAWSVWYRLSRNALDSSFLWGSM